LKGEEAFDLYRCSAYTVTFNKPQPRKSYLVCFNKLDVRLEVLRKIMKNLDHYSARTDRDSDTHAQSTCQMGYSLIQGEYDVLWKHPDHVM
jgi:hypothetical protein